MPSESPILTARRCAFVVDGDEDRGLFAFAHDRGGRNERPRRRAARRRCRPAPACRQEGRPARRSRGEPESSRCRARRRPDARRLSGEPRMRRPARPARCAGAPSSMRETSASGTDATTSSRCGSMTRSTGSDGRRLDEIAGVVQRLATTPSKVARTIARVATVCGGGRATPRAWATRRLGVGALPIGVLDFLARGDAALEQIARARLSGPGVVERGLRPRHFGLPASRLRRPQSESRSARARRRAARDRLRARHLRDARRLGRDDDQLGARCWGDDAGRVDDAADRARRVAGAVFTGTTVSLSTSSGVGCAQPRQRGEHRR